MARYLGPACRLCRREGTKLFLKGERCYTDKCAVDKRKTAPGQHGARRGKLSDFGVQLREKQKLRRIFGVLERQFVGTFRKASQSRGKTGEVLLQRLEMRLDAVVFKLGIAESRNAARQLVRHNHVLLNGKRCNIPSALLKVGDKITLAEKSRSIAPVLKSLEASKREGHGCPEWLSMNNLEGTVLAVPSKDMIQLPVKEQLIVELYSK
jgi:small subunit ribosomal protein S4